MYKVFLNDKMINIARHGNITLNKPGWIFKKNWTREELKNWLEVFVKGDMKSVVITHEFPEKFFELFQSVFTIVHAAGGVVLRNNSILFIHKNRKWDLPKGKIDPGETAGMAALREVKEECGVKGHKIVKHLPPTYHIYESPYDNSKGKLIFKKTFWFEMIYSGIENGVPQTNEGITKISWIKKNKLEDVLENTYQNLKEIISLYRS